MLDSLTRIRPRSHTHGKDMKHTSLTHYFSNGLSLANQSLDILCVAILLWIPSIVSTYLHATTSRGSIAVISALFLLVSVVFTLSIPVFLVSKQQGEALSYKEVFGVVARNTRRMILPVIVYFLVFGVFIFGSMFIFSPSRVAAFFQDMPEISKGWQPTVLIFIPIVSLFEFTSFFFSLENNGFFTSMKKSLQAAFTNMPYIALVILFGLASYSIISLLPIDAFWRRLLGTVLGQYSNLVLIATSLIYYQDVIKEEPILKTSRGRPVRPSQ
jgi:hypothetical protein